MFPCMEITLKESEEEVQTLLGSKSTTKRRDNLDNKLCSTCADLSVSAGNFCQKPGEENRKK